MPLVSVEQQKKDHDERKKKEWGYSGNGGHCGKCGLLLDALARTFCLPLLG